MSTLPNILPTANADSFNDSRAMTFSATPEKNGETFGHLMARALSPASPKEVNAVTEQNPQAKTIVQDLGKQKIFLNKLPQPFQVQNQLAENSDQIETAGGNFQSQSKNSKSSTQTTNKNPLGTTDGTSDVAAITSTHSEANVAVANLENISISILAPVIEMPDKKIDSNTKATTDVLAADSKATVTSKPVGDSSALSEAAKSSVADAKISVPVISQDQLGVKTNSTIKSDGSQKITTAIEALAVEKANPTDSKIAATTTNPQIPPLAKDVPEDLTTPKAAVESIVQSSQPEFSVTPDLTAKTMAQSQPDVNGTSVAKQDVSMTKTENPNKIADPAGKILPSVAVSSSQANNLPPRENFSALNLSRTGQIAEAVAASSSNPVHAAEAAPFSADSASSIAIGVIADVRSRGLERVQDIVVLHATRLSDSGNNSLQVVIKPGAGTQLSLELRQRGDSVEAQAVLQRGDFEHLKQQWPALQQQLEQRGIRLAPLISDGNFAGSGGNNFQQKQNQFAEPDSFPAFAEVAPISFAQPAARAGAHLGWESWA
jgi:hypothetical protein